MSKKISAFIPIISVSLLCLTGCSLSPESTSVISVIYGAITVLSLLLVALYCIFLKKREPWLLLLYISVFVVNLGYFAISVSKTLSGALWANRLSYLGSVFLPYSMLLTIMDVCRVKYKKIFPSVMLILSAVIFLITATPGYTDWYYKEVSINIVNGITVLDKQYGSLHCIYLFYLLGYFASMIGVITNAIIKKRIYFGSHAFILATAVFGNIAVWGIEQVTSPPFEFLSISYIITELFLLMLFVMLQQHEMTHIHVAESGFQRVSEPDDSLASESTASAGETPISESEGYRFFIENLPTLTAAEKNIYEMYVQGNRTKDIIETLGITENTIKTHNKRIYKKLGISSRKQMLEYAKLCNLKCEN